MTVSNLSDLIDHTAQFRGDDDMPVLVVVGPITRSVTVDETVVNRIGQVDGQPAYRIVPRLYRILDDGGIEITDDHPDWFDVGNDEVSVIDNEHITLALVAEPLTDELRTPPGATNVFIYPPILSPEVSDDE